MPHEPGAADQGPVDDFANDRPRRGSHVGRSDPGMDELPHRGGLI